MARVSTREIFGHAPHKWTTPLNLTLVQELLNQVDSTQADLRTVKQLQTKFLYCLNCYLTCEESLLEKLLLMKLKKVSLSYMRKLRRQGGAQAP